MSHQNRVALYERIEQMRSRPLITYITSSRPNAAAQMASDVIPHLIKQINQIPKETKEIDILIVSNGGDPITSWSFINLLRERFDNIGVLLPYAAYSAATLLALGANEIVMHPFANLGPVDPQLTIQKRKPQPGQPDSVEAIEFGTEDLRNFMDYVRQEVGISDQEELSKAFELVCNEVGAIPIGVAKRTSHLALSMGEQLLKMHITDDNKAKAIAETLNRSFYHHGFTLGRKEVEKIGLPLIKPDESLETLLWQVWEDFEEEMQINVPFDPLQVVLSDPQAAALLGPVQQVQLPMNLPPPLAQ